MEFSVDSQMRSHRAAAFRVVSGGLAILLGLGLSRVSMVRVSAEKGLTDEG